MVDLYNVTYKITDRGVVFPEKTEKDIPVGRGKTVNDSLSKLLNRYRYAQNLSAKFTFEILNSTHSGMGM